MQRHRTEEEERQRKEEDERKQIDDTKKQTDSRKGEERRMSLIQKERDIFISNLLEVESRQETYESENPSTAFQFENSQQQNAFLRKGLSRMKHNLFSSNEHPLKQNEDSAIKNSKPVHIWKKQLGFWISYVVFAMSYCFFLSFELLQPCLIILISIPFIKLLYAGILKLTATITESRKTRETLFFLENNYQKIPNPWKNMFEQKINQASTQTRKRVFSYISEFGNFHWPIVDIHPAEIWTTECFKMEMKTQLKNQKRNQYSVKKFEYLIKYFEESCSVQDFEIFLLSLKKKFMNQCLNLELANDILEWSLADIKHATAILQLKNQNWIKQLKLMWINQYLRLSDNVICHAIACLTFSNETIILLRRETWADETELKDLIEFILSEGIAELEMVDTIYKTSHLEGNSDAQKWLHHLQATNLCRSLETYFDIELVKNCTAELIAKNSYNLLSEIFGYIDDTNVSSLKHVMILLLLNETGAFNCQEVFKIIKTEIHQSWYQQVIILLKHESSISGKAFILGTELCAENEHRDIILTSFEELRETMLEPLKANINTIFLQKLQEAQLPVLKSISHYISNEEFIHWQIIQDHPVEKWIWESLIQDIQSQEYSDQENMFFLERFEDCLLEIDEKCTQEEAESVLSAVHEKQKQEKLNLDSISDIFEWCLSDIPSSIVCLQRRSPNWEIHLKSCWIQKKLEEFAPQETSNTLSAKVALHDLSNLTVLKLLSKVRSAADIEEFTDLVTFLEENSIEQKMLADIIQDTTIKGMPTLCREWLLQLQTAFLSEKTQASNLKLVEFLKTPGTYNLLKHLITEIDITKINSDSFENVLQKLTDYNADEDTCKAVFRALATNPHDSWEEKVHKIVIDRTFKNENEYSTDELIELISTNAPKHIPFLAKHNLSEFLQSLEQQHNAVAASLQFILDSTPEEDNSIQEEKNVNNWSQADIKFWSDSIKQTKPPSSIELISVVARGVELHYGYKPRTTQLLSVGMLLDQNGGRGCLAQIPTGEGKSLIVAMLACIFALKGETVDVVTSSTELSIPEVKSLTPFFAQFGLTVGENSNFATKREVYGRHIVYGTAGEFQGDILRSECLGKDIRGERKFGKVIVDEVDNLFYDNRTQTTRLSDGIPLMDQLELPLAVIWNFLHMIQRHFVPGQEKAIFVAENFGIDQEGNFTSESGETIEECGTIIKDPIEFMKEKVIVHVSKILRTLDSEESKEYKEYQSFNEKILTIGKEISVINEELESKILKATEPKILVKTAQQLDDSKLESKESKVLVKIAKQICYSTLESKEKLIIDLAEERMKKREELKTEELKIQDTNTDQPIKLETHERLLKELADIQQQLENLVSNQLFSERQTKEKELSGYNEKLKGSAWNDRYPKIDIPIHLCKLARHQIDQWVESAIGAMLAYKKGCHYDVSDGKIVPIDFENTGVFQTNMVWNNGLAQFLQIKEGLKIQPESASTNYLSAPGFFKRYGPANTKGLTGTTGTKETHDFFSDVFGTDIVVVPPHKICTIVGNAHSAYCCKELPAVVVNDENKWYNVICDKSIKKANNGQAVLIICKYKSQVLYLQNILQTDYPADNIFTYIGEPGNKFTKRHIKSGEILIATNIAGRGTDITTSDSVEQNGGLHVAITFLPTSLRVELQNVGRTCRKGKRGSAQLIIFDQLATPISKLKETRSTLEMEAIREAKNDVLKISIQDNLFLKYCALQRRLIPNLKDAQKINESEKIETAWSREEKEMLNGKSLTIKFKEHFKAANKALSKPNINMHAVCNSNFDLQKTEWEIIYRKNILDSFCQRWQGKVATDVMIAFQAKTPFVSEAGEPFKFSDNGYYERQGLAEQWAFWHHTTFSNSCSNSNEVIETSFDEFAAEMTQLAEINQLIQNPSYNVQKGNSLLQGGKIEEAIQIYEHAIEQDESEGLYADFNLAIAHLSLKKNAGFHQQKAQKALHKVKLNIDTVNRPSLLQLNTLIGQAGGGQKTSEHVKHKMDILEQIEQHADKALTVIKEALNKKHHVKLETRSLQDTFKDAGEQDYSQAINEISLNGITHLFTVVEIEPTPWWSILGIALLGIAQIVAGAAMMAFTGGTVGIGWISEGISDMILAVKSAITGTFSWVAYGIQKAVSLAIALISSGFGAIIKTMKEVGKAVVQATASTVREGIKLATKQVGLALGKGVAKECLNCLADVVTDNLFMKHIEQKITEKVSEALNAALSKNPIIQQGLALDIKNGNNHFQSLFIDEGLKLLTEKENKLLNALIDIAKGVAQNKVQGATQIFQASAVLKMMDDLVTFTDNFILNFNTKVDQFQADVDNVKKLQEEKEKAKEQEIQNHAQTQNEQTETSASAPNVTKEFEIKELKKGQNYSSELFGNVENVSGGYCPPSDQRHLRQAFQEQITQKLTNSVKSNLVKPITSSLVNMTVDGFTEKARKSLEEQRQTHRSACENDWSEADVAKRDKTNIVLLSSPEALSQSSRDALKQLDDGKSQGTASVALMAKALGQKICIYDKNGKLLKELGDGSGPPIKIQYLAPPKDGSSEGHYQPLNGTQVISTGKTNCLIDTVSSLSGKPQDDLRQGVKEAAEKNPELVNKMFENRNRLAARDHRKTFSGGATGEKKARTPKKDKDKIIPQKGNPA